jgi:hypothetical protein
VGTQAELEISPDPPNDEYDAHIDAVYTLVTDQHTPKEKLLLIAKQNQWMAMDSDGRWSDGL